MQWLPHCSGQLFRRECVGTGSCSQGPAKPWMSGCPAKQRCQAAAGARSPTSSKTSLTTRESQALFTAWLLSPSSFYTNQEHNSAQNIFSPYVFPNAALDMTRYKSNAVLRLHQNQARQEDYVFNPTTLMVPAPLPTSASLAAVLRSLISNSRSERSRSHRTVEL